MIEKMDSTVKCVEGGIISCETRLRYRIPSEALLQWMGCSGGKIISTVVDMYSQTIEIDVVKP